MHPHSYVPYPDVITEVDLVLLRFIHELAISLSSTRQIVVMLITPLWTGRSRYHGTHYSNKWPSLQQYLGQPLSPSVCSWTYYGRRSSIVISAPPVMLACP